MENPLVTISIPLYNCENLILNCLISVKNQSYDHFEVLLVNDNTKDRSREVAEEFIKYNNLNNWKIIDLHENGGLSVVRNVGIDNASGKYIFFVDSDDEILPDCIKRMVMLAESSNLQMVVGEVEAQNMHTGEKANIFPITTSEDILTGNKNIFKAFVRGKYPVSSWNKLINLNFIKSSQLYFTKGLFAQDALQSFETALKLDSIGFLREITYIYYLHQNSVIHNRDERHFNNWITIAKAIDHTYRAQKNPYMKKLILEHLVDFKASTLQMNWKAQKNEQLWKRSYNEYRKLKSLSVLDYLSPEYSTDLKKKNLFFSLPTSVGFRFFKWRYER